MRRDDRPTVDEVLTVELIPTVALPPEVRKVDVVRVEGYRVRGRGKGWRLWLADGAHWNYNPVAECRVEAAHRGSPERTVYTGAWQRVWGPIR